MIGYLLRQLDWFRPFIQSKKSLVYSLIIFVPVCLIYVVDIQTITPFPVVFKNITKLIGCWFVWSLAFQILKVKPLKNVLSYIGINSLGYYWLNGFALVLARTVIVSVMNIESSVAIAVGIFVVCAVLETLAIVVIKKIPQAGKLIGI